MFVDHYTGKVRGKLWAPARVNWHLDHLMSSAPFIRLSFEYCRLLTYCIGPFLAGAICTLRSTGRFNNSIVQSSSNSFR